VSRTESWPASFPGQKILIFQSEAASISADLRLNMPTDRKLRPAQRGLSLGPRRHSARRRQPQPVRRAQKTGSQPRPGAAQRRRPPARRRLRHADRAAAVRPKPRHPGGDGSRMTCTGQPTHPFVPTGNTKAPRAGAVQDAAPGHRHSRRNAS